VWLQEASAGVDLSPLWVSAREKRAHGCVVTASIANGCSTWICALGRQSQGVHLAGVIFTLADRQPARMARPEQAMFAAWATSEVIIAVTGGPRNATLG
jgi:hypothetical protein